MACPYYLTYMIYKCREVLVLIKIHCYLFITLCQKYVATTSYSDFPPKPCVTQWGAEPELNRSSMGMYMLSFLNYSKSFYWKPPHCNLRRWNQWTTRAGLILGAEGCIHLYLSLISSFYSSLMQCFQICIFFFCRCQSFLLWVQLSLHLLQHLLQITW